MTNALTFHSIFSNDKVRKRLEIKLGFIFFFMCFQAELFLLRLPMTRRSKSLKYVRCKNVPRTYFWENNKYQIFDVRMVLKMWNVTFLSLTVWVLKIFYISLYSFAILFSCKMHISDNIRTNCTYSTMCKISYS